MDETVIKPEEECQQISAPLQDVANRKRRRRRRRKNKKSGAEATTTVSTSSDGFDALRASVDSWKTEDEETVEQTPVVSVAPPVAPLNLEEVDTPVSEKNILSTRLRTNVTFNHPEAKDETDSYVDVLDDSFHVMSFKRMEQTAKNVETWSRVPPPEEEMPAPATVASIEEELLAAAMNDHDAAETVPEVTPSIDVDRDELFLLDAAINAQFEAHEEDPWAPLVMETKEETKEEAEEIIEEFTSLGDVGIGGVVDMLPEVEVGENEAPEAFDVFPLTQAQAPEEAVLDAFDVEGPAYVAETNEETACDETEAPAAEAEAAEVGPEDELDGEEAPAIEEEESKQEALGRDLLAYESAVREAMENQNINLAEAFTEITTSDSDDEPIFAGAEMEEATETSCCAAAAAAARVSVPKFLSPRLQDKEETCAVHGLAPVESKLASIPAEALSPKLSPEEQERDDKLSRRCFFSLSYFF